MKNYLAMSKSWEKDLNYILILSYSQCCCDMTTSIFHLVLAHFITMLQIEMWLRGHERRVPLKVRRTDSECYVWQKFMATFLFINYYCQYEFPNDLFKSHTLGLRMAGNIACAGLNVFNVYKDHNIVIERAVSM